MAGSTANGKAFEFALLLVFFEKLAQTTKVQIIKNDPYKTAQKYFDGFDEKKQFEFKIAANAATDFLLKIEPRLINAINQEDVLELKIVSDQRGQTGDVRDVLTIRAAQEWEIGISAKNNHRAVKHSRLSLSIDFGQKWLNIPCSNTYFESIKPIFDSLAAIKTKNKNTKWASIENMHDVVYLPVLEAFRKELIRLDQKHPKIVAERLVQYLIGTKDFYKVIKGNSKVEIQAYNIQGTLNQRIGRHKPKAKIQRLKLPTRLIEVVYKSDSKTTLIVSLDEGWQISFRIHNASSRVEPSLKFDINLISAPHTLFTQHIFLNDS